MKTNLYIIAGILALTNASCTDTLSDEIAAGQQTVIYANAPAEGVGSRSAIDPMPYLGGSVGILWTPDDAIGVYGPSALNAKFDCSATAPTGRAAFTGTCADPQYAYYPYDTANNGKAASALTGSLAATQSYDSSTGRLEGDYKIGKPREGAKDEFDFTHIFALLRFNVDATGTGLEGEKLQSVQLTLPAGRTLAGDFTFSAIDGSYTFTGRTSNTVKVMWADRPALTSDRQVTAYMSAAPAMKEDDEVTIAVRTDAHKATFTRHIAYDFEPNSVYTFDLKLSGIADLKVEDAAPAPELTAFEFTVAHNPGKILDRRLVAQNGGVTVAETEVTSEKLAIDGYAVSGLIPYLHDFALVADFAVADGVTVTVGGVEQTSGVSVQDFSRPVVYTLTNSDGDSVDYTVSVTNTGLPVVVVEQSSTLTTGSWSDWFGSLKVRSKDSDWASDDKFTVYNADGSVLMAEAAGGMRLRGNSTQRFPKKPFAIKFGGKQAPVAGLPAHKRWVLLANWLDCSMMRNNTAFAIAHAIEDAAAGGAIEPGLAWDPHGTSVELVIDGRHVGNYYLCEQIKIGGKRLNINDAYEDVVNPTFGTCGYLIECDDNYDENCRFLTARRYLPFMLKDDVPADYLAQIQTKVNGIEANIIDGKYTAAYADLDINSLIDQWIVYELTMNNEYKHPKSVYMYMNGDSKLCAGPVWDFDYQTFPNASRIGSLNSTWGGAAAPSASAWLYSDSQPATSAQEKNESDRPYMWYPLLFKDPAFRAAVQARWKVIYPKLKALEAQISGYTALYEASWKVNNAMWPLAFKRSTVTGWAPAFSGDEDLTTYAQVVGNLLAMYSARLEWMNTAITAGDFHTTGK